MTVPFLDLKGQYKGLQPEIDLAIQEVLSEARFIGGTAGFESAFAEYVGIQHCVGVANGTDALELALQCLDLTPGSEVIVPANSFVASSEAVVSNGLQVTFADVKEDFTLDVDDVQRRITANTSAIMPVHLYGQPADMIRLLDLAKRHDLRVVEDCAQAHGANIAGRHVGTFGDVATFSFFPGKNLGAYGDGGCVITNDQDLADNIRMRANHGRSSKFDHELHGRNSRLDGLQAAVLSVKLPHLDSWIATRRRTASFYDAHLAGVSKPPASATSEHAYHLYVIRSPQRDQLKQFLADQGIQTGIHYPTSLPRLTAYANHTNIGGSTPNADEWADQLLSLPIGDHMSPTLTEQVVNAVNSFG